MNMQTGQNTYNKKQIKKIYKSFLKMCFLLQKNDLMGCWNL